MMTNSTWVMLGIAVAVIVVAAIVWFALPDGGGPIFTPSGN